MAKDFQRKLFNVTAKGTVLKVIANSKEANESPSPEDEGFSTSSSVVLI